MKAMTSKHGTWGMGRIGVSHIRRKSDGVDFPGSVEKDTGNNLRACMNIKGR